MGQVGGSPGPARDTAPPLPYQSGQALLVAFGALRSFSEAYSTKGALSTLVLRGRNLLCGRPARLRRACAIAQQRRAPLQLCSDDVPAAMLTCLPSIAAAG